MAGDKRILIDLLLEASSTPPPIPIDSSERIRAAFLINSSSSPQACSLANEVEYRVTNRHQGLAIHGSERFLSETFEHFSRLTHFPTALKNLEPELDILDFQAAMLLISRILGAFERTGS